MSVWKPAGIEQEPEVILTHWSVYEIPGGDRHFCGYNILLREGRASSAIQEFDHQKMVGRTRSGRIYKLKGEPGSDPDARYVWHMWLGLNGIDPDLAINVTREIVDRGTT